MRKILAFLMTFAMVTSMLTVAPAVSAAKAKAKPSGAVPASASDFTWDNASVYFLLTDRFYNGNTSNDHSYNRGLEQDGTVTTKMKSDAASFQGGDFAGITKKINEGYFTDLGVNALWISAPYEQIQGYSCAGNGKGSFPHYSYHGYYAGDYSNFDQNFGTAEEFQTMVDTAHSKGIRVVLDIVMNHPGYNTMYDMNKFGFGELESGWEKEYYSFAGNNDTYHKYIYYANYKSEAHKEQLIKAWSNWWGVDWLRAGLMGYDNFGSGDILGSAGGELPDFKTENPNEVELPTFLKTKWTEEGTYETKMAEMNRWFSDNGKKKTVRNYLCYWLSRFVEDYGVDGFRCDTAKHVELESWAALKDTCSEALNNWRKNNPTKPAADWDENFWMTGEVYGKTLSNASDPYFAEGKFDSTINFAFSGTGLPSTMNINTKYNDYAKNINTSDNYNVLTYISSHDTSLFGRDRNALTHNAEKLKYQGSALQLLPGAIQIFYGDESGREYVKGPNSGVTNIIRSGNHDVRSFMNWDSMDNDVLEHWQKVGQFRNKHISVGAGTHKTLTTNSGAAFIREYNKNGVNDKVLCVIGAEPNTKVEVTLDSTDFSDGTVITNDYDGTTGVVYNGKVKFSVGANGTVLGYETGKTDVCPVENIAIDTTTLNLENGNTATLVATVTPENATDTEVKWSSDNESVATVDENGVVTAVGYGTATIKAVCDGKEAVCTVTVKKPVSSVKLNFTSRTLNINQSLQLKATVDPTDASEKTVNWESSNTKVATVDKNGLVKAISKGTATIKASCDGKEAVCKITVKKPVSSVKLNYTKKTMYTRQSVQLRATVYPTDASNRAVVWSSSNPKVATVSSTGKVTTKARGTAVITAKAKDNGKYARCTITVKQKVTSVKLSARSKVVKVNKRFAIKATAYPSNANLKNVKWSVSRNGVVKLSSTSSASGRSIYVTGRKAGTITLKATAVDGSRKYATCKVVVRR